MSFEKYQHVERLGNTEVEGIEMGTAYVFPKLDGTNGQVWLENDIVRAGSRNRTLAIDDDNAGFYQAMLMNTAIHQFLYRNPSCTLYGEWLVPHSLKTYRDDAWRKFYVFDVFERNTEQLLPYYAYQSSLEDLGIDYLAPLAIIKNGSSNQFVQMLDKNIHLIKDGAGVGEGIVIKNYDWRNKFGRQVWAKIVTNEFKEAHHKAMGAPILENDIIEQRIVSKFVTSSLIDKVYAKIVLANDGWTSKYIPQLLNTVFYDLVREEMWAIVKEFKNPKIDFRALLQFTIGHIKETRRELF